jgi:hypothetical protein
MAYHEDNPAEGGRNDRKAKKEKAEADEKKQRTRRRLLGRGLAGQAAKAAEKRNRELEQAGRGLEDAY